MLLRDLFKVLGPASAAFRSSLDLQVPSVSLSELQSINLQKNKMALVPPASGCWLEQYQATDRLAGRGVGRDKYRPRFQR